MSARRPVSLCLCAALLLAACSPGPAALWRGPDAAAVALAKKAKKGKTQKKAHSAPGASAPASGTGPNGIPCVDMSRPDLQNYSCGITQNSECRKKGATTQGSVRYLYNSGDLPISGRR